MSKYRSKVYKNVTHEKRKTEKIGVKKVFGNRKNFDCCHIQKIKFFQWLECQMKTQIMTLCGVRSFELLFLENKTFYANSLTNS